jgi:hypothetical protein
MSAGEHLRGVKLADKPNGPLVVGQPYLAAGSLETSPAQGTPTTFRLTPAQNPCAPSTGAGTRSRARVESPTHV